MAPSFDHEKLEVYQAGRQFNRELRKLFDILPRGHSDSQDQLKRAGKSITRNIAEGSGKWMLKDKIHFYHIARGSATEAASELDALVDYGALEESQVLAAKQVLNRVVAMLVRLILSLEEREGPDRSVASKATDGAT